MYFPPPWGEGGAVYFIILSSHLLLHGHYLFLFQVLHFLCTSSERFEQNCLIFPVSFLGDLCLPAQSPCFWLDCPPLGSDHLLGLKVFRPLCLLCLYTLALPGLTHNPVWEKHKGLHCYLRGLIRMIPGNSGYGAEPWWKSFLGQSHSWFTKLILDYSCYGQSWQVTWWGLESSWVWSLVMPLRDDLDQRVTLHVCGSIPRAGTLDGIKRWRGFKGHSHTSQLSGLQYNGTNLLSLCHQEFPFISSMPQTMS